MLQPSLTRFLLIGSLTGISIFSGVLPSLTPPSFLVQSIAYAQNNSIDDTEIEQYAQIVLLIEVRRQQAYDDIKQSIGSEDLPNIECHQLEELELAQEVVDIARNYCNESLDIVTERGLTASRFNSITNAAQADPNLKQRIQDAMLELQDSESP